MLVGAGSHLVRQALEVDYPKLVRLYGDLWRRLEGVTGEMRAQGDGGPATIAPLDHGAGGGAAHESVE